MNIDSEETSVMQAVNGHLISSCRHCQFYKSEGRRGGSCHQLGVPVQGNWKACSLAVPPFMAQWAILPEVLPELLPEVLPELRSEAAPEVAAIPIPIEVDQPMFQTEKSRY